MSPKYVREHITPGQSSSVSRAETAVNSESATESPPLQRTSAVEPNGKSPQQQYDPEDHQSLNHSTSKLVHLDPPAVVKRPPKFKTDTFSLTTLPWLSWNVSERKEVAHCARSTHISYEETATFKFFGLKLVKNTIVKTSEHGIDSAIQTFRLGDRQWVSDKREQLRARMHGYKNQREGGAQEPSEGNKSDDHADGREDVPDVESQTAAERRAPSKAHRWLHNHHYVVVGFMGQESVPIETLRRVMHVEDLFVQIRKAYRRLRSPLRRALSLKTVSGFGIYECDSVKGYHREVEVDKDTERALVELWRNYRGHKLDYEGRWLMWIHHNFNNNSKNAEHGKFTLEFKLAWSVPKVVFWGIIPVLLSLAIGFGYMYSDHGEVDDVAVAEAAWVIASYIVTTSARKCLPIIESTRF